MAKKISEYGENKNRKCSPPVAPTAVPAVAAKFSDAAFGGAKKISTDDTNVYARRSK
jgi:hypothetical protein